MRVLLALVLPLALGCSRSETIASEPDAPVSEAAPACLGLGPRGDACERSDAPMSASSDRNVAFLEFSPQRGNDLSTPRPEFGFPGLRAGDKWCLCAARWAEADDAGVAPPAVLPATHEAALGIVDARRLGI